MLSLLFSRQSFSQEQESGMIRFIMNHTMEADSNDINKVLADTKYFPLSKFYLAAELHQSAANPLIQFALIKKLQAIAGLKYVILEMSHPAAFIFNQYLENGDSTYIQSKVSDFRHSYWLLKNLYNLNSQLPPAQRIRFLGVDVGSMNLYAYRYCMTYFSDLINSQNNTDPLAALLAKAGNEKSIKELEAIHVQVRDLLVKSPAHYRQLLSNDYKDLLAIAHNKFRDRGIRDDEMFANFKNICAVFSLPPSETFFASFGASHVSIMKEEGKFVHLLDQYYHQQGEKGLCIIGIQYFNSWSLNGTRKIENDGIIPSYGSYKKKNVALLQVLDSCQQRLHKPIGIFIPPATPPENVFQNTPLQKLDILLLCKNFRALDQYH